MIGGGIAGIVSAWALARSHDVTLIERRPRLGGHTNTIVVPDGPDAGTPVDTGFIVCNDQTYPNFHRFIAQLGVEWRWSDMSFSFHDEATGFQYAGTNLNGLFACRRSAVSPRFLRMVADIRRFSRVALQDLQGGRLRQIPLSAYLRQHGFSRAFIEDYLLPMGAAIWSTPSQKMLRFPAATFVHFMHNHGLLALRDRPQWQTIVGGSHSYVKAFEAKFPGTIRTGVRLRGIKRKGGEVQLLDEQGHEETFDAAVVAVHADQVLRLLLDPTEEEQACFGPWRYNRNLAVLHTDEAVMPSRRRAWASWNYAREAQRFADAPSSQLHPSPFTPRSSPGVSVTYHMNRLQGLQTEREYFVTLNRRGPISEKRILQTIKYAHPMYTPQAVAGRERLRARNGALNTWYAGSYFGFGFHEDAVKSAVAVANAMACPL